MEEMSMKIKRILPFTIVVMLLSSCSNFKFEPFGNLSAEQIEEACKSYCRRIGRPESDAQYVLMKYELGAFGNTTYVDFLKFEKEGVNGTAAEIPVYVNDTYICSLNGSNYDLNVWVDGVGSYDIQDAYDDGKLSGNDIQAIINQADQYGLRESYLVD